MLVPNLLPKAVPHSGSRLLPGLIVRIRGRLVASKPHLGVPAPTRSPCPSGRLGGPHPGHPRPVAPLSQREGLLALRRRAPARLLPETLFPGPAQSQDTSPGARVARAAEGAGRGPLRPFGRLPRPGHDPHPGDREGEGISQGAVLRAGHLREERFQDLRWVYGFKVALVVDPRGVVSAFGLAPAASDERPIGEALIAEDLHEAYLAYTRASRVSSGRDTGWSATGLLLLPPRRTTPSGRGRRPICDGRRANARS